MQQRWRQFKKFFSQNECTILAVFAIILIGSGSYIFGLLKGMALQKPPLHIVTSDRGKLRAICNEGCSAQKQEIPAPEKISKKRCAFVGSKYGKKYYPPSCKSVKRIKPENLTCFTSAEDAQKRGYTKTSSCQ